jgi:hypothetical protein
MATKNPGFRQGTASAAMSAALKAASPATSAGEPKDEEKEEIVGLTVRLPKESMYNPLLDIVTEAKKRGEKVSIHSLMLEGIAQVIAAKRRK